MVVIRDVETTPMTIELDPEIENQVEWFIKKMMQNLSKQVGETVSLICDHALTLMVLDYLPGSALSWSLNDGPLVMDPSRVLYNKGNIDITDLTPGDSGVYECLVQWGPENIRQNITVGIYSLLVTSASPTRYVFESDSMQLYCHSTALGRLFPSSVRRWQFNSTDTPIPLSTLALNVSVDVVDSVSKAMTGVWQCLVYDVNTSRTWDTAWYRIAVDDQPSFIARIYRFMLDHLLIVAIVGSILLVICCGCFGYAAYKMKNSEDETDEEFRETRNGWEQTLSSFAEKGEVTIDSDDDIPEKSADKDEDGDSDDDETSGEKTEGGETSDDEQSDKTTSEGKKESSKDELDDTREKSKKDDDDDDDDASADKVIDDDKNEKDNKAKSEANKSASRLQRMTKKGRENSPGYIRLSVAGSHAIFGANMKPNKGILRTSSDSRATKSENVLKVDFAKNSNKGRRRNRKQQIVIYPAVNKEQACRWLLNNAPSFKKTDTILQEMNITSRQSNDLEVPRHNFTHVLPDLNIRLVPSNADTRIKNTEGHSIEYFVPPHRVLRGKSLSRDHNTCAHGRSAGPETRRLPDRVPLRQSQDGNQEQGWGVDSRGRSSSHFNDVPQWGLSESGPNRMKSWLVSGKDRLRNWTAKQTSRDDRRNVNYTVLPQMDEEEFVGF